jgi:hypothetical protein
MNIMEKLVFSSDLAFLNKVWKLTEEEVLILCPICNGRVIFAPNWNLARIHGVPPGAYCSVDRKHLTAMFEIDLEGADL